MHFVNCYSYSFVFYSFFIAVVTVGKNQSLDIALNNFFHLQRWIVLLHKQLTHYLVPKLLQHYCHGNYSA